MTSTLLVRSTPQPGESLNGFLIRLAEANLYPNVAWVTKLLGVSHPYQFVPPEQFARHLAVLTGLHASQIMEMTVHRFSPQLNLDGGSLLERSALMRFVHHKRLGIRFCPECTVEMGYWSVLWQLRPVTMCLRHRRLLVERCRGCGAAITMGALQSRQCACGSRVFQNTGPEIPSDGRGFSAQVIIQELLHGNQLTANGLEIPVWFASLDFLQRWMSSFPTGCFNIDGVTTATKPERRRKFWEPVEVDYVHYTLATEILREGQSRFSELCCEWLQVQRSYRNWDTGFHRDFARLDQLLREFPSPAFSHLHNWVTDFIAHEWTGGYPSRLQRVKGIQGRMPLERAAETLQCRTSSVVLMMKNGLLQGVLLPLSMDGIVRGLVDAESVQQAARMRHEAIPLRMAGALTGFSPWLLRQLCLSGVLKADRGPLADGTEEILIHRSRLASLVDALIEKGRAVTPDLIPLEQFGLDNASGILYEVLQGHRAAHVHAVGGRILQVLVGETIPSGSPGPLLSEPLSLNQAAHELGVTEDLVKQLGSMGLLQLGDGTVMGCRSFKDTYLWEHDASQMLGVPITSLRRWCKWGRIRPVHLVGHCQIFRHSELLPYAPRNRCSVKEAAQILGRNPQDVRRYFIARGILKPLGGPGVDDGREIMLDLPEILATATRQPPLFGRCENAGVAAADLEQLISSEEAARILGLSVSQFQARFRRNNTLIPCGRQSGGRQSLFIRTDVERYSRSTAGKNP